MLACLAPRFLVGNASAAAVADCTQSALSSALRQGGVAYFTTACTVSITSPIVITNQAMLSAAGFTVTLLATNTRVFEVAGGASLVVDGIRVTGASSTNGGALLINSGAVVTLRACTFAANYVLGADGTAGDDASTNSVGNAGGNGTSGTAGDPGFGGAIYNLGTLNCSNCTFVNNRAFGGNGGAGGNGTYGYYQGGNGGNGAAGGVARGGAIYNLGGLCLDSCSFTSNSVSAGAGGEGGAAGGGAFSGWPGNGGAGAGAYGGALWTSNAVSIVNSSFTYNLGFGGDSATGGTTGGGSGGDGPKGGDALGGGLIVYGSGAITNGTFYGNYVRGGMGGQGGPGDYIGGKGGNGGAATGAGTCNLGSLIMVNCTLAVNGVLGGTNGAGGSGSFNGADGSTGTARGANLANSTGTIQIKNSIMGLTLVGPSAYGTLTDAGYNLCADSSVALTNATSSKSTNPKLGALAANGGLTVTMLPQPGSPAANRGSLSGTLTRDQRGGPRPGVNKTAPDIGAVEGVLPIITTQPLDQLRETNSAVSLTVAASGDAPFLYRWYFNGTNLPAATSTNATYSITALAPNQFGPYFAVVSNAFGAVTSRVATIYSHTLVPTTVVSPLVISNQFWFAFSSYAGLTYRVEYKAGLTDTNWTTYAVYPGTGYLVTNRIPIGTNRSAFYRVVTY